MINKRGKFKPVYWLHGMPFLLITVFLIFDFYHLGANDKLAYYELQDWNPNWVVMVMSLMNNFLGPIYVIWSLIKLRSHMRTIADDFSYTEQIDLNWLKYVLGGLGFVWLTVLFTNVFDFSGNLGDHLIYLSVTIAVFFLGYFGIKQRAIYVNTPEKMEIPESGPPIKKNGTDRYKNSGLKKSEAKEYVQKLLSYMANDKPYLNGKLSLKDVAEHLDVSVYHLSQVINEQLGKNFFDFINAFRTEEVKRHIDNSRHKQYTLLAVAHESGFNSKSSFNSIFKKFTGVTPSEYIKNLAA